MDAGANYKRRFGPLTARNARNKQGENGAKKAVINALVHCSAGPRHLYAPPKSAKSV